MRSLILRPLFTLMLAISALALLKLCVDGFTRREFEQAHQFPVVLFGDSHGNDVPVKQVPRFNRPAQDLVSTWMRMRELADLKGPDSKVEVVVLTIWPMKFGPVAERRMSGRVQEDGWQQSVLGEASPMLRWGDLFRSEWPWRLRWQLLLNGAQLERVRSLMGWVCRDGGLPDGFVAPVSDRMVHEHWFEGSRMSTWAFEAMVDLARESGWQLLILEHPMHPSFFEKANSASLDDYRNLMQSAAALSHVHYLGLGWDVLPNSAFIDFHHLSCEGMEYVGARLDPLLEELRD